MSPRPYRLGERESGTVRTRARILEAAQKLLASESGSGGLSIDAVAREAGVVRMTVYYQFKSKLGLLEALFDDLAQRGGLEALPAAFSKPDPAETLYAFIDTFCAFYRSHRVVLRRLRAAAVLDPELESSLSARNERRRHALRVLMDRWTAGRGGSLPRASDDTVDLLQVLTSFETFDALAATRRPEQVAELVAQTARAILAGQ